MNIVHPHKMFVGLLPSVEDDIITTTTTAITRACTQEEDALKKKDTLHFLTITARRLLARGISNNFTNDTTF